MTPPTPSRLRAWVGAVLGTEVNLEIDLMARYAARLAEMK